MPTRVAGQVSSNDRLYFSASQSNPDQGDIVLRKARGGEAFGRGVLNVASHLLFFIPGVKYTKNWHNPQQWSNFKKAMLAAHAADILSGKLTRDQVDTLFATYSQHKRLTQAKVSNILDDLQRMKAGGHAVVPREPKRLNSSQGVFARGLRSLWVRCKGLNAQGRELRGRVEHSNHKDAIQVVEVLRPGKSMKTSAIQTGQEALKAYADASGKASFEFVTQGHRRKTPLSEVLNGIRDEEKVKIDALKDKAAAQPDDGKPVLLSIPLMLKNPGGVKGLFKPEDHSVGVVVDFKNQKLTYLDSKGHTLEEAAKHYPHRGDMRAALAEFGAQMFGAAWNSQEGILQLTQAKQQGANDCGAFTHDFTRRLIEGQSVGDIERSFTAEDRWQLRVKMAQDIETHLIPPDTQAPPLIPPADAGEPGESKRDSWVDV